MIEIKILETPTKDNAATFVISPSELDIGGRAHSLVDALHFTLPEAWTDKIVTVSFQPRDGEPVCATLPADGMLPLIGGYTATGGHGELTLRATGADGYDAYTLPAMYRVYDHPPVGDPSEPPPDRFEELVRQTAEAAAKACDLTNYVQKTDYASKSAAGVIKVGNGLRADSSHNLTLDPATETLISAKQVTQFAITPNKIDYAVKIGVTTNTNTLTDEEKEAACGWLGSVAQFDGSKETGDLRYTVYGQSLGEQKNFPISQTAGEFALALYTSGGNLVVATPRSDTHAATKGYVDKQIGDIETALDGIITIQNELIGGDVE